MCDRVTSAMAKEKGHMHLDDVRTIDLTHLQALIHY